MEQSHSSERKDQTDATSTAETTLRIANYVNQLERDQSNPMTSIVLTRSRLCTP